MAASKEYCAVAGALIVELIQLLRGVRKSGICRPQALFGVYSRANHFCLHTCVANQRWKVFRECIANQIGGSTAWSLSWCSESSREARY